MVKRAFLVVLAGLFLSGCATHKASVQGDDLQQLQSKVVDLEIKLEQTSRDVSDISDRLNNSGSSRDYSTSSGSGSDTGEFATEMTPRKIQTALKNAGYYDGSVDGKIGKMTKRAIKDFQSASGLKADGVVGKATWSKLREHLNSSSEK